jgi:hypothetical protein
VFFSRLLCELDTLHFKIGRLVVRLPQWHTSDVRAFAQLKMRWIFCWYDWAVKRSSGFSGVFREFVFSPTPLRFRKSDLLSRLVK